MVERALSMREAPGSIPGISIIYFVCFSVSRIDIERSPCSVLTQESFMAQLLVGDVAQW